MKKIYLLILIIIGLLGLTRYILDRTPADTVVPPDAKILEQQKAFDEAMMKKNGINK